MKQSNWLDDFTEMYRKLFKEAEDRGAAREREKWESRLLKLSAKAKVIADELAEMVVGIAPANPVVQPKKRKAVEANAIDIQLVREIFDAFEGPMIPKQIAKHTSIGIRRISRACIALSNQGVLDGGHGGWRLAQRKENGLDETVSAESSAR